MRDMIKDPWIQTASGRVISLLNPRPEDICISDIAHGLSNICRFAGAVVRFYSVAEHSVRVSRILRMPHAMYGLLHDSSECYLMDIPRPLKLYLNGRYEELEKKYMKIICGVFHLPVEEPPEVRDADQILLVTERRDLLLEQSEDWNIYQEPLPGKIEPLLPQDAEKLFLSEFRKLFSGVWS